VPVLERVVRVMPLDLHIAYTGLSGLSL